MDSINLRYSLDLTGIDPDNLINREEVVLLQYSGATVRPVVLDYGFYYTDSLRLYDADYRPLRVREDYVATYHSEELSERSGLEVCGAIVVTNPHVSDNIYAEYRTVGGDYVFTGDILEQVLDHVRDVGESIEWGGLKGEPVELPPGGLRDEVWKLDSFEIFNRRLEEITQALLAGDQTALTYFRSYIKVRFDQVMDAADDYYVRFLNHLADLDRPHRTTKAQVGLSRLENYPVASRGDMEIGSRNDRYVTPRGLHEAVDYQALVPLQQHKNDTSNPHQTTAALVGVHTRAQFDNLLAQKLDVNAKAVNSTRLEGHTYGQVRNNARANIPAANFTSGVFNPSRLGLNSPSSLNVLRGDGRWMAIAQIFEQYDVGSGGSIYYIGRVGSVSSALSQIRTTYADIRHYPVGTIILYRYPRTVRHGYGNGRTSRSFDFMNVAHRTASGWQSTEQYHWNS